MHGLGGEKWKRSRHMWPVPNSTATNVEAQSYFKSLDFFCKEGRKIQVGDCALFKPPKESPPFIGIIRSLTLGAEDTLSLGVNWLYRPADIRLPRGPSLEAAPNELFYSFHKDEILAASLLHPCKVAFLCKGIELPQGISSFVCRRVYDIDNKCLWWLNDKDYINERQEEVDQLLNKTRLEMHGAVQSGGRSPKPLNGLSSTPQLKSGPDSASSFSSQAKGKKRERVACSDQVSDSVKRERLSKTEDNDSGQLRPEVTLKSEIARITDKGGLVDAAGVEKLVQLMQPDSAEKKLDLAARIMLVDVISGTERNECLGRFVQLRGLPVLDEWLQEVHKGKIGDGVSPKEIDRSVEEFLLALLRALDRLPVNLHALQTCNVGKSVNYLRSHKNSEIQKKARSLVDMWKKRVEAEMNMNDAKSGSSRGVSWQNKPVPSSESGSRKLGNSAEIGGPKSSASQPSVFKTHQVKLGPGDVASKSPTTSKPMNASGNSLKDQNFRMLVGAASSDLPLMPIKEEKSTSSSQSQNNSQSSEHAKTVGSSCKEDARSSTAGSVTANKVFGSASRHRKSSNGLQGPQKETGSVKAGIATRNLASERSSTTGEKNVDATTVNDHGNSRLIVRFPNTGRSPARGSTGISFEDSVSGCGKASSPPREKHDNHHDKRPKSRNDVVRTSALPEVHLDGGLEDGEERQRVGGEDGSEVSKASKIMSRPTGKSYDAASFSSINALVESCAKISRAASASASPGDDDVGMNLLASVAAGEITKSENASPSGSPEQNPSSPEASNSGNDGKFHHHVSELGNYSDANLDSTRHPNGAAERRDESGESKTPSPLNGEERERTEECSGQNATSSPLRDEKPSDQHDTSEACAEEAYKFHEPKKLGVHRMRSVDEAHVLLSDEDKKPVCADDLVEKNTENSACSSSEMGDKDSSNDARTDQKPLVNRLEGKNEDSLPGLRSGSVLDVAVNDGEKADNVKVEGTEKTDSHAKISGTCSSSSSDRDKDSGKEHSDLKGSLGRSSFARLEESKKTTEGLESKEERKPETGVKLDFDLNESFSLDESSQVDHVKAVGEPLGNSAAIHLPCCPLLFQSSPVSTGFPASITVAAPAKGGFYPLENPLRSKTSLGWKGSAATSAFRPAEPRKSSDAAIDSKPARPLDFDLNVADGDDEEEFSYGDRGGLDLDLNRLDDNHHHDAGAFSVFGNSKLEIAAFPAIRPNGAANIKNSNNTSRDFDLNNGPGLDESAADAPPRVHQIRSGVTAPVVPPPPPQQAGPIPGMRLSNKNISNAEYGNFSSWFPPANSYSAITVPPIFTERGEHSYVSSSPAGSQRVSAFGHEIYRGGPVLSSSPAVAFPPSAQIPYPGFPFETGFPLSSNSFSGAPAGYMDSSSAGGGASICFPAIHSPLMGPGGIVSSAYPRPYVMNHLPGGVSHISPDGRKWGSQGLDLNAGPGGGVAGEERLRQLPVTSSQALMEEQLKMFGGGGGVLKRKEPDSGIDSVDRISYKEQHTWQ